MCFRVENPDNSYVYSPEHKTFKSKRFPNILKNLKVLNSVPGEDVVHKKRMSLTSKKCDNKPEEY